MRLFIALDLSIDAKESIEGLKKGLIGIKGVKPVAKENIHITLKFLGEVADNKVNLIIQALSLVKFEKFKLTLGKLGVFPNENKIQVLWVDAEPTEPLLELKKQIDAALPSFKDDHPFKNHLTFARVKYIANESDKKKILESIKKPVEKSEFSVDKFVLYKSELTPAGPVYDVIKQFS
jgi:2'-5' RNA ligase